MCVFNYTYIVPISEFEREEAHCSQTILDLHIIKIADLHISACITAYYCIISTGHKCMNPIDRSKNNAYGGEAIGVRLHSIKFLESYGKNVTRNRKLELECLGSVFVEWVDNSLNRG